MKIYIKSLIITAVFFLAFTNRASADFHFNDPNFISIGNNQNGHSKSEAILLLLFINRVLTDLHLNTLHLGSFGDNKNGHGKGDKGDHGDHGFGDHHGDPGGGSINAHDNVAPEPVSYVLFLFGAGVLALSYRQRKKLSAA